MTDSRTLFSEGTPAQYEHVYGLYDEALTVKALQKNKKVEDYVKLDRWYQNDLPKKIKARGKDAHLVHEELVKCMKWKMNRGKFIPRIKDLVQMNTPRLCITETKKSFRALLKKDDLAASIAAMCNLKGIGPSMASVMLTAADPAQCGFMADECLMAIPEIDSIDYTTKELLNFVSQLKIEANRLTAAGGNGWTAHKVEMTLWAHYVLNENKRELLDGMPSATEKPAENGVSTHQAEKNGDPESSTDSSDIAAANKENLTTNGATAVDEDSNTCDSMVSTNTNDEAQVTSFGAPPPEEDTNDSIATTTSGRASSNAEEDNINTASPPQQVSEDTNDSLPQESSSDRTLPIQNGNGHVSSGDDTITAAVAVAEVVIPEQTTISPATTTSSNEDSNTSDSLPVVSDSTSDSIPEPTEKLTTTVAMKMPLKDESVVEEPSAKRTKLEE